MQTQRHRCASGSWNFSRLGPAVLASICCVFFAGCGRQDINVYYVSKEPGTVAALTQMPENHPPIGGAVPQQLKWNTPDGWQEAPLGTMRVASFQIADADGKQANVSVIPLAGTGGGDLENVNRWRGEVGQPPVTEEQLKNLTQSVQVDGLTASVFETNGTTADGTPARIVAAILHRDGTAWFFKMAGDDALVAKHKSAFLEFLKSFQFIAGEPLSAPPVAPLARNGRPQWDVPPGWKEAAAGQFLVAKFVILGEDNARAEVNVSSAAGDGGGLAANVNRWRRQLGLSVLSDEELSRAVTTLDTVSGAAALVEMQGKDPRSDAPASVVGIIAPVGGSTWFYKLTGDAKLVEAQRDAFINFAKGARY